MLRRSDEDNIQLPSDPDYITPPTDRRKCGAERISISGEGSISVPSPVKEIKFEKQGRAQEQSALCSAHVTANGYRPALRYPTSNSIPSPVKRIQAPQSQVISDDDDDYELPSTLQVMNKLWMRMRLWMTFTDTPKILCMRAAQ